MGLVMVVVRKELCGVKVKARSAVNMRRKGSVAVISSRDARALTTMGHRADHEAPAPLMGH